MLSHIEQPWQPPSIMYTMHQLYIEFTPGKTPESRCVVNMSQASQSTNNNKQIIIQHPAAYLWSTQETQCDDIPVLQTIFFSLFKQFHPTLCT